MKARRDTPPSNYWFRWRDWGFSMQIRHRELKRSVNALPDHVLPFIQGLGVKGRIGRKLHGRIFYPSGPFILSDRFC